jgi:hypothetical protein
VCGSTDSKSKAQEAAASFSRLDLWESQHVQNDDGANSGATES